MKNKIKTIIAEDVETYLETIAQLIGEVAPEVQIVGKATSLSQAKEMIKELSPDLVFLDIQFEEEGTTAFDMLQQTGQSGQLPFRVIFITAHLESAYYAEAFKFGALHFLEKPVDKEKLRESINRAGHELTLPGNKEWLEQLKHLEKQITSSQFPGKLVVEGTKFTEVIQIPDIVLLEAAGRYTSIKLCDGKELLSCQNLGEYELKLKNNPGFCRIHHNKIINLNFVRRFSKKERIIELVPPYGNHIASKERMKDFISLLVNKM
jgi:two-component system LytT family response regulator